MGHKGPVLRPRCIGPGRARTQTPFNSIQTTPKKNIVCAFFCSHYYKLGYSYWTWNDLVVTWKNTETFIKSVKTTAIIQPLHKLYIYEMYLHHNHATNVHMRHTCKNVCILHSHSWWTFRHKVLTEILESKLSSLKQWRGSKSTFKYCLL
jgi:hypothetical protein